MPDGLYDVAIIGSGPAGSTAAYHLARSGARVVLIEKSSPPRYKTCGGGLIGRSLHSVFIHPDEIAQRKCYKVRLHLHDTGLSFTIMRDEPVVTMVMREEFDFQLLSAAKNEGAEIVTECELLDLIPGQDRVQLTTTTGMLAARFVVAADGAAGITSRKAGWDDHHRTMPALEYEVSVDDNLLHQFGSSARFDVGMVPFGYAWVFPKKNHLSVGVLTTRKHSANLNEGMKQYLQILGIGDDIPMEKHGFMIPAAPRGNTFVRNRVMLVGDAAGFVDPLTGEGISFALKSGELASRSLIGSNFTEHHVRHRYEQALNQSILPELRYGRILAKIFYDLPKLRNWLFRNHGQRLTGAITSVMMGEKSYRDFFCHYKSYLTLLKIP